jgi:uncharacterized membrane protein YqjE
MFGLIMLPYRLFQLRQRERKAGRLQVASMIDMALFFGGLSFIQFIHMILYIFFDVRIISFLL